MPDQTPDPNWTQAPPPPPAAYTYGPPPPSVPNPVLAGLLGVIPGVGAMYNGQFAKAIAHFLIFAVLASLADNHGFFGLLVFGWICYQSFEAYHTARARRDGLPLPNPFGLNDIGERLGFNKGWTSPASPPPASPYASPVPPPPAAPPSAQANWTGYVPPAAYAAPPAAAYPPPPAPPVSPAMPHVYADTYTGPVTPLVVPPAPPSRFPVAALVLIGLGVLILLGNLLPDWRIRGEWIVPIALFGIAIFVFVRRLRFGGNIVCMLRAPVILATLGVLSVLQTADVASLSMTWPVLLLAIGGVLLLERTVGRSPIYAGYAAPPSGTLQPGTLQPGPLPPGALPPDPPPPGNSLSS